MKSRAAYLDAQKRQTKAFIDHSPVWITLIPREKTSDGAGGWTLSDGEPRPQQRFALIPQSETTRGVNLPRQTSDGLVQVFDYILLGEVGTVIGGKDYWVWGQARYEVEYLFPDNGYEVRAGVMRRGL